jgi:hypothetical protein
LSLRLKCLSFGVNDFLQVVSKDFNNLTFKWCLSFANLWTKRLWTQNLSTNLLRFSMEITGKNDKENKIFTSCIPYRIALTLFSHKITNSFLLKVITRTIYRNTTSRPIYRNTKSSFTSLHVILIYQPHSHMLNPSTLTFHIINLTH